MNVSKTWVALQLHLRRDCIVLHNENSYIREAITNFGYEGGIGLHGWKFRTMSRLRFREERSSAITSMQKTMTTCRPHYISTQSSSRFNVSKHAQNMLYSNSHSIKWYTSSLFHSFFTEACKWDSALLQTNEDNIVARRTSLVTLDNTRILYTHTESRRQKQNNRIQITLLNDTDIHQKSNPKS